jgi:hypothetical protein
VIRPPLRIRREDKLRHLVLMAGKVSAIVKFQDEFADFGSPLAHFQFAGTSLLGRLGVLREQCDVPVGIPRIECPAVPGIQFIDLKTILSAR